MRQRMINRDHVDCIDIQSLVSMPSSHLHLMSVGMVDMLFVRYLNPDVFGNGSKRGIEFVTSFLCRFPYNGAWQAAET